MNVFSIILQIILLAIGLILVVAVLFQKGEGGLSGSIAGGSDSFMNREKDKMSKNALLNRITIIGSIVFVLLVIVVYVIQPDYASASYAAGDAWKELSGAASYFG